jgi:hypothetical protein
MRLRVIEASQFPPSPIASQRGVTADLKMSEVDSIRIRVNNLLKSPGHSARAGCRRVQSKAAGKALHFTYTIDD